MKFNAAATFCWKPVRCKPNSLVKPSFRCLNSCGWISSSPNDIKTSYAVFRGFSWKNPFMTSSSPEPTAAPGVLPSSCARSEKTPTGSPFSPDKADWGSKFMNERLAGACLDLLELCRSPANGRGARPPCDSAAKERLWKVAEMLLRESAHAPAEQFDIVYDALRSPIARGELPVRRALMVVLEGVAPGPVYRLFEAEDLIAPAADAVEGASRRASLEKFIHALLGRLEVPDGLTAAEVLRAHAEDFKRAFPTAALSPAFLELEKNAVRIAAQARLIKLLAELFAAFDKERTGKVPLAEFQRTAERVLGKEMTGQLLEGVRTDAEGNLAYAQLTALLTQLPPSQIREKNQ